MARQNRVWIVGRSGRLGAAMVGTLGKDLSQKLLVTDLDDLDVRKLDDVEAYAERHRPDIIVNGASKGDRAWCEAHPDEAFALHALGARNLAIAAEQIGAHLFSQSTDFVFDGTARTPYREFDRTNPQTVYGQTKLAGEIMVRNHCPRHTIIRSSWMYGKKHLHNFLRQGKEEGRITVAGTMLGSPTSSLQLAESIIALMGTEEYGTFHMTCEGECDIRTFIEALLEAVGFDCPIQVSDAPNAFEYQRPQYSVLDNYMLRMTGYPELPHWRASLTRFVQERHVGEGIL